MTEPTKACIRVLKGERAFRRVLTFPFRFLFNILEILFGWMNWCIARAVMRWASVPLLIYFGFCLVGVCSKYKGTTVPFGLDSTLIFVYIVMIVCLFFALVFSWVGIPVKEQEILDGKYD